MRLKIDALRTFAAVVDHAGLAGAADALGRTPGALSMTLKRLEAELGGPLFESDRKARLTPLGAAVRERAVAAIESHDGAMAELRRIARGEQGALRVAATPSVARRILPPVVARMAAERPGLHIELRDVDSATVAELVAAGAADLGVAAPSAAARGLEALALLEDPFVVLCRRDHPLAAATAPVDWATALAHPLISNGLCDEIDAVPLREALARSRLRARNVGAIYGLVEQGLGVALLPSLAIPLHGALTGVALRAGPAVRLSLLTRAEVTPSPAARSFTHLLRAAAAAQGATG